MKVNKPRSDFAVLFSKNGRLYFFVLCIVLVYAIFIGRLFYLQIMESAIYRAAGAEQYSVSRLDNFNRGKIYFSKHDSDPIIAASVEDQIIERNGDDIQIRQRVYPLKEVGAKVLGFVSYSGNDRVGQYGIERTYEDVLSRDSSKIYTNFFAEIFGNIKGNIISDEVMREGDVILTIDAEVEYYLHTLLTETQKEWKSDVIGGIIMDPNDGRIIAMEELPTFDPNLFTTVENTAVYKNDLVSGVYEMGSIIKPLTVASALDAGIVNENTTYNDTGFRILNGFRVSNYDGRARGTTPIQEILSQSLNIGIVYLVEQLGTNRFQDYFRKLGIGTETGIDLPSEARGLTNNLGSKIFVDSATSGFGQGIAITPIQTVRALATLGNGGKLVNPYVVDSVNYANGDTKKIVPDPGVQVLDPDTSAIVSKMLTKVVDTALLGGKYKKEHYTIAAKTGTAQMVAPNGKYYDDRYLHSFFGYFPANNPRFIVFLYHTNPKGAQYASATLTDTFFKLTNFLISYFAVSPDR